MRLKMSLVLMLGLLLAPIARAETPINVQIEVSFLLGFIDGSGCEFNRNGSWYDSKAAQAHLRDKYKSGRQKPGQYHRRLCRASRHRKQL